VNEEKEGSAPKPPVRGLRLAAFAFLPLVIGWAVMEGLAFVYFAVGPSAREAHPPIIYGLHPYRIYELVANRTDESGHASHNSHNLRGRDLPTTKPADTVRIVCLGGSTTYGVGATTDSHTYPAHMERFLRERYAQAGFAVEVINGGHPAYASLESLILFQTRLLDFSPDVAILHNSLNDAWMATNFSTYAGDYSHGRHTFGPLGPSTWEYSPLLSLLFAGATSPRNPYAPNRQADLIRLMHHPWGDMKPLSKAAEQERARQAADVLERNTLAFISIARGNHAIPVISTETSRDDGNFYWRVLTGCNERLRTIAARESVALVDFAREMPWNPRAFFDPCHLRDRPDGLELKGKIFADALIRAGVVERAARQVRK